MKIQAIRTYNLDGDIVRKYKDSQCLWCGDTIPKGQVCVRRKFWFGKRHYGHMHLTCADFMEQTIRDKPDNSFIPTGMKKPPIMIETLRWLSK